jgi:hypothetical protein
MPAEERKLLDATFERALAVLPTLVKGDINAAMTALHTDTA